jgi:NADH-quinone oxidoreductase subunit G
MHHIFGSEELSAKAAAISELSPEPYFAVNSMEFAEGEKARITWGAGMFTLPVRIRPDVPRGVAGIYSPGAVALPAWGTIERVR